MNAARSEPSVATASSGTGPALVLIHGVGTNSSIWERAVPILSERRRVTSIDLPGFGASPPPPDWELGSVADLIAEALTEELEEPFELIGSSLGGAIAITLADRHPRLVRRMVLAAPAGFRPAPGPLPQVLAAIAEPMLSARRRAGLRLSDHAQARRALLAGTVADGAALDSAAARLVLGASAGARSLGPATRAAAAADLREPLARLATPFGLVWGSQDRVIPATTVERILELHPDTPVEIVSGAGHIPHLELPDRFSEAVERVLSQLP